MQITFENTVTIQGSQQRLYSVGDSDKKVTAAVSRQGCPTGPDRSVMLWILGVTFPPGVDVDERIVKRIHRALLPFLVLGGNPVEDAAVMPDGSRLVIRSEPIHSPCELYAFN